MPPQEDSPKAARRQHYVPRFYLRNFAEPAFSDNLNVYSMRKRCWESRTPRGVGWCPHLYSVIDEQGKRRDEFDQKLKVQVEDPAALALKRLAQGQTINEEEKAAVALFIALTAARSPAMMSIVLESYTARLSSDELAELETGKNLWCDSIENPSDQVSNSEYLKPSILGAIWEWSKNLQCHLLQWQWHLARTSREKPFVTSDRPVLAQWDRGQGLSLVTFPVSSEIALILVSGGQLNVARNPAEEVYAMNRGTMQNATEFVVACRRDFPAFQHLRMAPNHG